jgi:hypothetical protein
MPELIKVDRVCAIGSSNTRSGKLRDSGDLIVSGEPGDGDGRPPGSVPCTGCGSRKAGLNLSASTPAFDDVYSQSSLSQE